MFPIRKTTPPNLYTSIKNIFKSLNLSLSRKELIYETTFFFRAYPVSLLFSNFYVLHITLLGEQTGTLDIILEHLSEYYEQEHIIYENLRRAITSPMIMLSMIMAILFILFTKVMPIFTGVYTQLGASIPKIATLAIEVGGFLSGVDLKSSFTLAQDVLEHPEVKNKLELCTLQLEEGKNFSEVVESDNLFSDFDLQMIRTGTRTGQLEAVLRYLDSDYNRRSYATIQNFISRLEPTIILVLAISTGMVLLSVMLPLVGILCSIT